MKFSQKSLKTNEFGTISSSFILDENADLGDYSIQISQEGRNYYGSFSVEEYKKPEYLVKVKTDKEQYAAGDTSLLEKFRQIIISVHPLQPELLMLGFTSRLIGVLGGIGLNIHGFIIPFIKDIIGDAATSSRFFKQTGS